MEENREPLSAIAIEKKLQLLRNKHFSEDTIALVKIGRASCRERV